MINLWSGNELVGSLYAEGMYVCYIFQPGNVYFYNAICINSHDSRFNLFGLVTNNTQGIPYMFCGGRWAQTNDIEIIRLSLS